MRTENPSWARAHQRFNAEIAATAEILGDSQRSLR